MREVLSGSGVSSKDNFNIIESRKNSINLIRLIKFIKLKKKIKRK
jgi:hypothetical protein